MTKLKTMRLAKGVTQAELADAAGVTRPFMLDLENGHRNARDDTWQRLATILNCEVSDIYYDKNRPEDEPKKFFRYYCPERPPIPGIIPRGVVRIEYADSGEMIDGSGQKRRAWGAVEYDRELTDYEITEYGLERG